VRYFIIIDVDDLFHSDFDLLFMSCSIRITNHLHYYLNCEHDLDKCDHYSFNYFYVFDVLRSNPILIFIIITLYFVVKQL